MTIRGVVIPIRFPAAPRGVAVWLRAAAILLRAAGGLAACALAHPGAELRLCRQTGRVSVR